ncbi:type II secretion system protein [Pelomonas sp. BJYL3]|uniref:type II secretion system protein n=1 Tax=Pelomonas sp. BJYL3 TaxID=2976697 RepID=UPI0022B547F6|nr:type II secretion system protein [Pelomonas sp. BJYL3]
MKRATERQVRAPAGLSASRGFTLLEVVIALSIIGLLTAVAVPALAKRLESAFESADLAQVRSSAELLSTRLATLGVELRLDAKSQARLLPDGRPPLDLPPGWTLDSKAPPVFGRLGACEPGEVQIRDPRSQRQWRLQFAAISCTASFAATEFQ